ncbi:phosphotransferase [Candidatus Uabimicrobium sp. HlEnr_7]|uniref:phosphotransferase n=1 Tax=Candidatus Uabimicrobium helgolandensis TaxID=3095367 RepID=UPI0035570295
MTNKRKIIELIEGHYSLGKINNISVCLGGMVNDSYIVTINNNRYFFRLYKNNCEQDILIEHDLLCYLQKQRFKTSPQLLFTKTKKTYVHYSERYGALFGFLDYEIVGDWDANCDTIYLQSAAQLQASYHRAIFSWQPPHQKNISIKAFLENLRAKNNQQQIFGSYNQCIEKNINKSIAFIPQITNLPKVMIHGDYHLENIMFHQQKAVAILDFDWIFYTYRIFDIALAIFYFCSCWKMHCLCPHKAKNYLENYQKIAPISKQEHRMLNEFITIACLYLLSWLSDCWHTLSQEQQKKYLEHFCCTL